MADTGPCGRAPRSLRPRRPHPRRPPGSPDEDGDRFIEIWNNVFMQFNMDETRRRHAAACALRGHRHGPGAPGCHPAACAPNYEIDLFDKLIRAAARETCTTDLANPSLKVIADHIRATAFPGERRRAAQQRRPGLRAAPHHPPRHPPWLQAGAKKTAVLPQAGGPDLAA